jgi:integrase/recombinase XerD
MKQARVLNDKQLKAVLAVAENMQNGPRNKLLILLSHYMGLRVGEIAILKWSDLLDQDFKARGQFYLEAQYTKSKEARQVLVNLKLQREIQNHWDQLHEWKSLDQPVIESQRGGHFSANSLVQAFTRIYDAAGIEGASSHSGRRWFITQLAHKGVSPKVIMELAGHQHLGTTQRYIDVNDEMKTQAVSLL